ncbi:MAG: right-handed parallel beta-helix repeat-containing protein [Spirochaetota bacterium]
MRSLYIYFLLILAGLPFTQLFGGGTVDVRQFGAIPGDGKDDAVAIRTAIASAISNGIGVVRFEAGRYDLMRNQDGNLGGSNGAYFLRVSVPKGGMSIEGAVDEKGNPATTFMGKSLGEVDQALPTMLRFIDTEEATLRNIIFDWDPWMYSSGVVTSVDGNRVTVAIRAGHPQIDGMKPYNLGVYDPAAKAYISGRIYTHEGKSLWRTGSTPGTMVLDDERLASRVKPGLWVFWFLSYFAESVNLHVFRVGNLVVSNVWMHSANGFGAQVRNVRDAFVDGFRIVPTEGRIATTTRDGFRFALTTGGDLRVTRCHFEGVQDDCQSVYSTHLVVDAITGPRSIVTRDMRTGSVKSVGVIKGSTWGFYGPDKLLSPFQAMVETFSFHAESNRWSISFNADLPAFAEPGAVICNISWAPRSYTLTETTFVNCNATGSIIQTHNVFISNNHYRNMMEPAVLIGSATYGEGMPTRNIQIVNNRFENCGVVARYGLNTAIGMGLLGDIRERTRIENVLIQSNTFRSLKNGGIRIGEAVDVDVTGNDLSDCAANNAVIIANDRTDRIRIRDNRTAK